MKFGSADKIRCLFMGLWFVYPWNSLLFEFFCFFAFFHPSKSKILHKITKIGGKQTNYAYLCKETQGDIFSYLKCYKISKNGKDIPHTKSVPIGGVKVGQKIVKNCYDLSIFCHIGGQNQYFSSFFAQKNR